MAIRSEALTQRWQLPTQLFRKRIIRTSMEDLLLLRRRTGRSSLTTTTPMKNILPRDPVHDSRPGTHGVLRSPRTTSLETGYTLTVRVKKFLQQPTAQCPLIS